MRPVLTEDLHPWDGWTRPPPLPGSHHPQPGLRLRPAGPGELLREAPHQDPHHQGGVQQGQGADEDL